jgi:hypothetical protein
MFSKDNVFTKQTTHKKLRFLLFVKMAKLQI